MLSEESCVVIIPELDSVVADIAREDGWTGVRYDLRPGSKAGDNYVGVIYRATVTGERDGKQMTKSLVCKTEPESLERRENFRTAEFFNTEAIFYNDIMPAYRKFQTKSGLPESQHFSAIPSKCYYAGPSTLILKDMNPEGFVMRERREALDVDHCRLVVKELGHFHAISFALRDQDPEEFRRLSSQLQENVFVKHGNEKDDMMLAHCETLTQNAIDNFKARSKLANNVRFERLLKEFKDNYYSSMVEAVRADNSEPYSVINHGDCWTNNLLFKYTEGTLGPKQLCFLDFQITRFASPVTDLAYFFFACTDKKMRDQHYDQLMIDYHNSLSEKLELLGSDPQTLFPFEAFQDQLQMFGKFGLGMATLVLPLFTCDPNDASTMDALAGDVLDMTDTTTDLCWERMNEVIEDMVERDYLGT